MAKKNRPRFIAGTYRLANWLTAGGLGVIVTFVRLACVAALATWIYFNGPTIAKYVWVDPNNVVIYGADQLKTLVLEHVFGLPPVADPRKLTIVEQTTRLTLGNSVFIVLRTGLTVLLAYLAIWTAFLVLKLPLFLVKEQMTRLIPWARYRELRRRSFAMLDAYDELAELAPPDVAPEDFVDEQVERFRKVQQRWSGMTEKLTSVVFFWRRKQLA